MNTLEEDLRRWLKSYRTVLGGKPGPDDPYLASVEQRLADSLKLIALLRAEAEAATLAVDWLERTCISNSMIQAQDKAVKAYETARAARLEAERE